MIGFAITYVYNENKNICNEDCIIAEPPVCDNGPFPALTQRYRDTGGKILLSFGGAGMGGSWEGDVNDCWDYCFGKEEYVVDRLVALNEKLGMDGIDIDYEYYYENDQYGRGFTKGPEAIEFLTKVTLGLREKLPPGNLVTHAPMDIDLVPGTAYFDMLTKIGPALDFIMPQYYNGVTRPNMDGFHRSAVGNMAAADHYKDLLDQVFNGDATRIVFGFCIEDCTASGSNIDATGAVAVTQEINREYNCNGGVFFWALEDDRNGWSAAVNQAMNFNRGCTLGVDGEGNPELQPTRAPITFPPVRPYTPPTSVADKKGPDFFDPNNALSGAVSLSLGSTLALVLLAMWNI